LDNKRSIFFDLPDEEKELVGKHHICAHYKRGDLIYKEGDRPLGLVCLSAGKVKVFKEGVGGREQIVRLVKPVGFIGYRALFADDCYNFSAVAIDDCSICIIEREALFSLVKRNGEFALRIIRSFAMELGFSNTRTVTLTQKHIRGRLAESLLFLKDTYGLTDDGMSLNALLSREDLANLSNMTTSNAIRTLSNFTMEGVITVEGRHIRLLDVEQLERISSLG
jgi:CRP-like cAMP-binding protein